MFFSPDSKNVFISTARDNLPGPKLMLNCKYPYAPTTKKYTTMVCQHDYRYEKMVQVRRGDEAPSQMQKCIKCNLIRHTS